MGQDSMPQMRFTCLRGVDLGLILVRNNLAREGRSNHGFLVLSNTPGLLWTAGGSLETWNGPAAGTSRLAAQQNLLSATVSAKNKTGAPLGGAAVFP
jgi:hypothetical protein